MKKHAKRSADNQAVFDSVWDAIEDTPDASAEMKLRSSLMMELTKLIELRKWTQKEAANALGVTQPRISDLMRGKISLFGSEGLTAMLDRAGAKVEVVVTMGRAKSSRAANTRQSRRKTAPTTTRIQPSK